MPASGPKSPLNKDPRYGLSSYGAFSSSASLIDQKVMNFKKVYARSLDAVSVFINTQGATDCKDRREREQIKGNAVDALKGIRKGLKQYFRVDLDEYNFKNPWVNQALDVVSSVESAGMYFRLRQLEGESKQAQAVAGGSFHSPSGRQR